MADRFTVIRFNREEQPIATADFATEKAARETFNEWAGFRGQSAGGVQMVSPRGFILARHVYEREPF